jgi:hypothetical protein
VTSEDNEGQFIRSTSADQFYASEHCRALGERNRHADSVIREQEFRTKQAFDERKHQLALSPDSNAGYNGTRQSRATGRAAGRGLNP